MSQTRQRILDGFADQLLEAGYRGISLDAITKAIGIRRPSLYHHFPGGKEEIYVEVALTLIDADAARVAAAIADPGGLRAQLRALALIHADDPRKVALDQRIFDATREVSDEARTTVSTRYVDGLLAPVQALMAGAVEDGLLEPRDPWLLMQAFSHLAQVVPGLAEDVGMPPEHRGPPGPSRAELAEQVVELFLSGAVGAEVRAGTTLPTDQHPD